MAPPLACAAAVAGLGMELIVRRGLNVLAAPMAMKRAGSSPAATSSFVRQSASSAGQGKKGVVVVVGGGACHELAAVDKVAPHTATASSTTQPSSLSTHAACLSASHNTELNLPAARRALTDVVQVKAVWVVAGQALEEGVAVLCGTKAGAHRLALPHSAVQRLDAPQRVCERHEWRAAGWVRGRASAGSELSCG